MDLVLEPAHKGMSELASFSDEILMARYQTSGDQTYFEELVRRHQLPLYRHLFRYLKQNDLTEDLCQKSFLQLYLKNKQFQTGKKFKPWFYRLATNLALDFLRREKRYTAVSLDTGEMTTRSESDSPTWEELIPDPNKDPYLAIVMREECEFVRQAILQLPSVLRSVVQMVCFQGMKYQEIADLLQIPYVTIRYRFLAALKQLENYIKVCP